MDNFFVKEQLRSRQDKEQLGRRQDQKAKKCMTSVFFKQWTNLNPCDRVCFAMVTTKACLDVSALFWQHHVDELSEVEKLKPVIRPARAATEELSNRSKCS